jgi:Flp pilus assembly protein TadB
LLRTARSEQLRSGAYRAGAGVALASGLLSVVVTNVVLLATSPAPFAKVFALLASVVPLLLSFLAFRRAATHGKELERALEQAWLSAARRVSAETGDPISAAALARALRTDEARAEFLLAELSVQDLVEPHAPLGQKLRVTELADASELSAAVESEARAGTTKP